MATKTHLRKVRPNPFAPGETINGTLCNRVAVCAVGMNTTEDKAEVSCCFCKRLMKRVSK